MRHISHWLICGLFLMMVVSAHAQNTTGVVVTISAVGEIRATNDQAVATFSVEEQHADQSIAANNANQKMRLALEAIKKIDGKAVLQTRGYFTYPVYSEPTQRQKRQQTGWRVGQYLEVTTTQLQLLPQLVATAQKHAALSNLQFGLADDTAKKFDAAKIEQAYRQLQMRLQAIAKAMGKRLDEAVIENIEFDGARATPMEYAPAPKAMRTGVADAGVAEPSFEAGESQLSTTLVARVKFK